MSWKQKKHQYLCFHYWDYLTNFWRNNWRSIIDVVERLCSWVKSEVIVLHIFCNFFLSLKSRAKSQMFQTAGTAINASWMSIVAKAGVYVQALYYGLRKTTWIWHLNCKGMYRGQNGKGNSSVCTLGFSKLAIGFWTLSGVERLTSSFGRLCRQIKQSFHWYFFKSLLQNRYSKASRYVALTKVRTLQIGTWF